MLFFTIRISELLIRWKYLKKYIVFSSSQHYLALKWKLWHKNSWFAQCRKMEYWNILVGSFCQLQFKYTCAHAHMNTHISTRMHIHPLWERKSPSGRLKSRNRKKQQTHWTQLPEAGCLIRKTLSCHFLSSVLNCSSVLMSSYVNLTHSSVGYISCPIVQIFLLSASSFLLS